MEYRSRFFENRGKVSGNSHQLTEIDPSNHLHRNNVQPGTNVSCTCSSRHEEKDQYLQFETYSEQNSAAGNKNNCRKYLCPMSIRYLYIRKCLKIRHFEFLLCIQKNV